MAEFLGTFLLVLYVCSFGLPIVKGDASPPAINGGLGSGLIVASLVWGLGHIGGANLNPAVSIALLVTGESNLVRVFFYIISQLLGSTMAILTLVQLVPDHLFANVTMSSKANLLASNSSSLLETKSLGQHYDIGLTLVNQQITPVQAVYVEIIITFILIFCVFACIDTERKDLNGSFPLSIGFAVTIGALFGGKFTGGSMNPARSFGPALVANNWENHWVYWIGPILGKFKNIFMWKEKILYILTIDFDLL